MIITEGLFQVFLMQKGIIMKDCFGFFKKILKFSSR